MPRDRCCHSSSRRATRLQVSGIITNYYWKYYLRCPLLATGWLAHTVASGRLMITPAGYRHRRPLATSRARARSASLATPWYPGIIF